MLHCLADRYAVRFIPRENGMHYIHVRLNGQHIAGSPFRVMVGKQDADASLVRAYGDGLSRGKTGTPRVRERSCRTPCHAGCSCRTPTPGTTHERSYITLKLRIVLLMWLLWFINMFDKCCVLL